MNSTEFYKACEKSIKHLEEVFSHLQIGRASTGLIENIDVYIASWGSTQKLNQTANIGIIDSQTLKIEPRDKSILSAIEKAIYDAGLGFTPLNQGEYIMIKVPPLTEERRKDLTKIVASDGEEAKIAIRNHRHDARKTLELQHKAEEISENEQKSAEKKIDEITKEFNEKIDHMVKAKSQEILTI